MKAGFLQFNPVLAKPEQNIKRIEELVKNIDFDLLVMPELANSGYFFSDRSQLEISADEIPMGNFCKALQRIAKEKNGYIVSGICEKEGDKFYNSAVLVSPAGEIKTYRKIHLFHEEKKWFEPGNYPFEVHEIKSDNFGSAKVGMMICFDWIFPEAARTLALKGAQIICHPSNLVLQYCQQAMYTRAVENRVFTVTANRTGVEENSGKELKFTGVSVMLDPKGNYLAKGSLNGDECIITDIDPALALNKDITEMNNIFDDRRTGLYSLD